MQTNNARLVLGSDHRSVFINNPYFAVCRLTSNCELSAHLEGTVKRWNSKINDFDTTTLYSYLKQKDFNNQGDLECVSVDSFFDTKETFLSLALFVSTKIKNIPLQESTRAGGIMESEVIWPAIGLTLNEDATQ